jgi:hypothetical protein
MKLFHLDSKVGTEAAIPCNIEVLKKIFMFDGSTHNVHNFQGKDIRKSCK